MVLVFYPDLYLVAIGAENQELEESSWNILDCPEKSCDIQWGIPTSSLSLAFFHCQLFGYFQDQYSVTLGVDF